MNLIETSIPGVVIVEPEFHPDHRGHFMETYHRDKFAGIGLDVEFVQDNHSFSKKGTIRGFHYQVPNPQGKMVRVVRGAIMDVAVDIRVGSPTFGQYVSEILTEENRRQMYMPPGFTHGFCTLTDTADLVMKCTTVYSKKDMRIVSWNDPDIGVEWPITDPILSEKDIAAGRLADATVLPQYIA